MSVLQCTETQNIVYCSSTTKLNEICIVLRNNNNILIAFSVTAHYTVGSWREVGLSGHQVSFMTDKNHTNRKFYKNNHYITITSSARSVLLDTCREFFYFVGDFNVSEMQDERLTKSLFRHYRSSK